VRALLLRWRWLLLLLLLLLLILVTRLPLLRFSLALHGFNSGCRFICRICGNISSRASQLHREGPPGTDSTEGDGLLIRQENQQVNAQPLERSRAPQVS
jgi:hypothetical protein